MNKEDPKHYWQSDSLDEQQGLCMFNDPEKQYRCYVKWDGMIHFWFYDDEYGFNCDAGEYGVEAAKSSHHNYYWCIGGVEELDDVIARLHAIKECAKNWYAKHGKRWPPDWVGYVRGDLTIEQACALSEDGGQKGVIS